jgi:kinesin family protein 5
MYEVCAQPAVEDVLNGYNGTIFAYGQTGSGKTYTMFGPNKSVLDDLSGIIPRSIFRVFHALQEKTQTGEIQASVQASFLEIYCEEIRDLLNPSNTRLKLHETPSKGVWVEGLSEVFVSSAEEALGVIEIGDKCRSVASTKMNETSSRSHSVFMLNITQQRSDGSSWVPSHLLYLAMLAQLRALRSRLNVRGVVRCGVVWCGVWWCGGVQRGVAGVVWLATQDFLPAEPC